MRRLVVVFVLVTAATVRADWPHYGGGPEQIRYSPLTQITPANVTSLKVAWTYDTGDAFEGSEMQCQPVVAHGVLYATSPKLRVFALDAATGAEQWSFDPTEGEKTRARTRIRGLMYWERGDERRIYFGVAALALRARREHGQAAGRASGSEGRIDLRQGFRGRDPRALSVGVNTPGVFFRDLLILGSVVPEGLPSAPGDIRAFDVHTGAQRWAFHTIPHPGELGYDTWPKDAWKYTGGANAWAGTRARREARPRLRRDRIGRVRLLRRATATATTCSPTRSSACARPPASASGTSRRVKHDVWDRDFPAPPALITITRTAAAATSSRRSPRTAATYVLDRETGEPVFPMEEIKAPPSDVPASSCRRRRCCPTLPPPFTRQRFTEDLITKRTPEADEGRARATG